MQTQILPRLAPVRGIVLTFPEVPTPANVGTITLSSADTPESIILQFSACSLVHNHPHVDLTGIETGNALAQAVWAKLIEIGFALTRWQVDGNALTLRHPNINGSTPGDAGPTLTDAPEEVPQMDFELLPAVENATRRWLDIDASVAEPWSTGRILLGYLSPEGSFSQVGAIVPQIAGDLAILPEGLPESGDFPGASFIARIDSEEPTGGGPVDLMITS